MNMMRVVAAGLVLSACGSNSVSSVGGRSVAIKDAVHTIQDDPSGTVTGITVTLTDQEDLCEAINARDVSAPFELVISLRTSAGATFEPGSYTVQADADARAGRAPPSAHYAWVFLSDDAADEPSRSLGGTVELESFSLKDASGTFEIDFGASEPLHGSFSTPLCGS